MYSLSTCWNSYRHTDGRAMLREIRQQGFEYAELSHGIRISLLPGIFEAVDAGEIKISSLHNFCPLPLGVNQAAPNIFQFSSKDTRERESAFKHTVKTIETAVRVKASLVVLHMGSIDIKPYTDKLKDLIEKGQRESEKFEDLSSEAFDKREAKKEPFVENAYTMLERIAEVAEKHGIRLGVENREALEEIPFESDLSMFFRRFTNPTVGYWHDTGHAQIKEELGFVHHRLLVESMEKRLFGFHLHDVKFPLRDHNEPGAGIIDFASLAPMIKPEHIKVFEFKPSLSPEEVQRGVAHVKKLWGEA
jgi:sugar phosphate isomerase/epimerase